MKTENNRMVRIICVMVFICILILDYFGKVTKDIVCGDLTTGTLLVLFSTVFAGALSFVFLINVIYGSLQRKDNIFVRLVINIVSVESIFAVYMYYLKCIATSEPIYVLIRCHSLINSSILFGMINLIFILLIKGLSSTLYRCKGVRDRIVFGISIILSIALIVYMLSLYYSIYEHLKVMML